MKMYKELPLEICQRFDLGTLDTEKKSIDYKVVFFLKLKRILPWWIQTGLILYMSVRMCISGI